MNNHGFHTDDLHDLLLPGDVAADQSTELGASAGVKAGEECNKKSRVDGLFFSGKLKPESLPKPKPVVNGKIFP